MTNFLLFLLLIAAIAVNIQLKRLLNNMPNLQERFDAIEAKQQTTIDKLNEASTEILAELELLRGMNLPPEAEASLQRIEAKADGLATQATTLADVSPPVP